MPASNRRYDIDWIRVIAIGLLLLYHVAIAFQPWGIMIGFITNEESWGSLWIPMTMLNVWRIPLLFFVSGMGVYFAMGSRNYKQLLLERSQRILIPFLIGTVIIVPVHTFLWQRYNEFTVGYTPNPGHLWFLGNILAYVVVLSPVFYFLKKNQDGKIVNGIKIILSNPLGLLLVAGGFVAEALIIDPNPYEMYAMTWHGFFLGLLAFVCGFFFVLSGDAFWKMIVKWRFVLLCLAMGLFTFRLLQFQMRVPDYQLAIESVAWVITVLAFGNKHLDRSSKTLAYLSEAAYPVYIMHMIFLAAGSWLIFPLAVAVQLKFILVLLFTFAGCFAFYEFIVRRLNLMRVLFGLKPKRRDLSEPGPLEEIAATGTGSRNGTAGSAY